MANRIGLARSEADGETCAGLRQGGADRGVATPVLVTLQCDR